MNCYICNTNLTKQNSSKEHIIPNSLGGRLKASILCRNCNSKLGEELDANLYKQLAIFATLLNHKRDRGNNQDIEVYYKNMKVFYTPDGNMYSRNKIQKVEKDNKSYYSMSVLSSAGQKEQSYKDRAIKQWNSLISGLAKKNNWSKERIQKEKESFIKQLNQPIIDKKPSLKALINIGGKDFFWAMVKICINFYVYKKRDIKHIKDILYNFINYNASNEFEFKKYVRFYNNNLAPDNSIYHAIVLKGDKDKNILYAVVSLYSSANVIIFLNKNYKGEGFTEEYYYDLIQHKEKVFSRTLNTNYIIENYLNTNNLCYKEFINFYRVRLVVFADFLTIIDKNQLLNLSLKILEEILQENIIYKKDKLKIQFKKKLIVGLSNIKGTAKIKYEIDNMVNSIYDLLYELYIGKKLPEIIKHFSIYSSQIIINNIAKYPNISKDETIRNIFNSLDKLKIYDHEVNSVIDNLIKRATPEIIKTVNNFINNKLY